MYYLYILKCADGTLYTGITTDFVRRLAEHNYSARGAKYTAVRRPVTLAYLEEFADRSLASIVEAEMKKRTRAEKLKIIFDNKKSHS